MTLVLPWPPSANHYWKRNGARYFIAPAGVQFRVEVKARCAALGVKPLAGQVAMTVTLVPGDRRRRDIDNVLKPLLDALTHAGAWLDDSQVARLVVERRVPNQADAGCVVTVEGWPP